MRKGEIPEDASTELLSGMIVLKDRAVTGQDPTKIGLDHTKCGECFSDLRTRINNDQRHVESQQPLVCSDIHQPEPDFMVVRGTLADAADLPTAADAYCVVEVADSSYERDTGEKLRACAEAGVQQYIVINLRNRTAEVYTNPNAKERRYPPPQVVGEDGVFSLRVGENEFFDVALSDVLPLSA
jgi:Uma2 family endonuclease